MNDIAFHPHHGTLATVGSDGRFSFWDKDARTKLKTSEQTQQPITCCAFNARGQIFAYAVSYDWSKVGFRILLLSEKCILKIRLIFFSLIHRVMNTTILKVKITFSFIHVMMN